ncbi:hypothetical protein DIPPA_34545 [Diplonema papillatum]|nr:hypothetical protein DIPPA_34545 [Diplonema papillatum]
MMGVTASGQRSRSVPVNGSFAPSPSQRRNRYVKKDTSAMLHHDTSVTRSETPRTVPHIRLVTPASPRPDSPSGRRRSTSHPAFKFNQTFLTHTDARPTENSMLRVARLRNEAVHGSHGYGDIIGNQYSGSMSHITPKIAKLRTGPIVISLPKVEYKYKGPTQQHPHPLPANSDIFNKQAYQTKTCQDMSDVVTASGKGCIRGRHGLPVNESDIFNQHSGHAKAPATPRGKALLGSRNMESRSFGRSRSYTPAMRVFPPWDTS